MKSLKKVVVLSIVIVCIIMLSGCGRTLHKTAELAHTALDEATAVADEVVNWTKAGSDKKEKEDADKKAKYLLKWQAYRNADLALAN